MTKALQPRSDKVDSLGELLDSMHVEVKELGSVFTHNVWSKAVLVPPSQHMDVDEPDETIDAIRNSVVHCFSPDEPDECMKRLELLAQDESHNNKSWAKETLSVMQNNDPSLMKVSIFLIHQLHFRSVLINFSFKDLVQVDKGCIQENDFSSNANRRTNSESKVDSESI
jgi:hypothetical protein